MENKKEIKERIMGLLKLIDGIPETEEDTHKIDIQEKTGRYILKVQNKVSQHGVLFNDVTILEGWRLPTINEAVAIANQLSKKLDLTWGENDFWIEQCFDINKANARAGFLYYDGNGFRISCDNLMINDGRSRGVLLVREE